MRRGARFYLRLSMLALVALAASASLAQTASIEHPQRIVSLAPSVTETLFALGFGDRVVGVTTYCNYPPEAQKVTKIGGFMNPSLEVILSQRPDLVIGVNGTTDPSTARALTRLGIKVKLISLATVDDIWLSINNVARSLRNPGAGERLVRRIQRQFAAVERSVAAAPRRRTLLTVGRRPLVAVGGKNFIDELITRAGGQNIAGGAARPWLNLPDEFVVATAPQVIIEAGTGADPRAASDHWNHVVSIPAVKERRIYVYASDKILRPGPRIGEGLEELARLIHPECFIPTAPGRRGERVCASSRP